MADKRGGKRPGAGRKPGKVNAAKKLIAEDAKKHGAQALNTLVEIMGDVEAPHSTRVSAATAILDRGYGKPHQSTDVTSGGEKIEMPTQIILRAANADGDD